jgi:predicted nucleotidyltransferase
MEILTDNFPDIVNRAQRLVRERFCEASAAFLCGSILTGENTPESDYDFVVLYEKVEKAHRESFLFEGRKVEAFIHDPETLTYFFEKVDVLVPSLCSMIDQGLIVKNEKGLADKVKSQAHAMLLLGPKAFGPDEIDDYRYAISDMCDDLRFPRNYFETISVAARLYAVLAEFYLRTQGHWSASGKHIPRALNRYSPEMAYKFLEAFKILYTSELTYSVIALAEEILSNFGGMLFDGYHKDAPLKFRRKRSQKLKKSKV